MSSLISRASLGLGGVRLPLQCWSAAPQPLFRMLLRTHLSPGLFQGNESSEQMWQSPSKQEGKCSPFFQLLLSSLQTDWSLLGGQFFCYSQPSFPCLIRNRSVFLWLNSPNSPRGEMWNKRRINYFKTKILSSLGIKLESENEKHRRSLSEPRCFTEFSPWQFFLIQISVLSNFSIIDIFWTLGRNWAPVGK